MAMVARAPPAAVACDTVRDMMTGRWLLGIYVGGGLAAVLLVVLLALDRNGAEGNAGAANPSSADGANPSEDGLAEASRTVPSAPVLEPEPGSLWRPVEPSAVDATDIPAFAYVVDVPGKVLVRVAPLAAPRAVGDAVEVEIPQLDAAFQLVAERVQSGPGSTRSVAGHAEDDSGGRHSFVLTTGPRSMFARIGTPEGAFELAANRELGWLMRAANMDRHVDYSKPDTYIVRPGGPDRPSHAAETAVGRIEALDAF